MKVFHAEIDIAAMPEAIWAALTDAALYPRWNSTIDRIEGQITNGGRITVVATLNPGRAFRLTVGDWDPPRSMTWSSGMPLGLFTGQRVFAITAAHADTTHFSMREEYSGVLAPMITKFIPDLRPAFEQFAADLKAHLEPAR